MHAGAYRVDVQRPACRARREAEEDDLDGRRNDEQVLDVGDKEPWARVEAVAMKSQRSERWVGWRDCSGLVGVVQTWLGADKRHGHDELVQLVKRLKVGPFRA